MLLYRAMACPYFFPVARFETSPWSVPPRLPLGDAFSGECRALSAIQPDETRMREVCNLGYGRHGCEQFPERSAADAVRFHVSQDSGELIKIQYVFEKDCCRFVTRLKSGIPTNKYCLVYIMASKLGFRNLINTNLRSH